MTYVARGEFEKIYVVSTPVLMSWPLLIIDWIFGVLNNAVHQRGMVHLDIKPENIMVKNDLYKLGDFGLVNLFTNDEVKARATNITPDI